MAPYDILKNGETQEYTVRWKSHCCYVWDEKGVILNCLPNATVNSNHEWNTKKSVCLPLLSLSINMYNVLLLHDNATFKCMQQRPSKILHGQCHHIHPTFLTLPNQIITCLVIWKEACEDTIMPMRNYCRMLCSSGFRERATFTVWEYTLAEMSKMETTQKNDYAFSNDAVKFCEIFSCPMHEEHETKLGFINSDCLYTICLPNYVLWQSVSAFYSHEVHEWWINLGLMHISILLPFIITVWVYTFYIYFNILNLSGHEY
jgi:hypothetical protein